MIPARYDQEFEEMEYRDVKRGDFWSCGTGNMYVMFGSLASETSWHIQFRESLPPFILDFFPSDILQNLRFWIFEILVLQYVL
jgi:hypothetical protein